MMLASVVGSQIWLFFDSTVFSVNKDLYNAVGAYFFGPPCIGLRGIGCSMSLVSTAVCRGNDEFLLVIGEHLLIISEI